MKQECEGGQGAGAREIRGRGAGSLIAYLVLMSLVALATH